MPANYKSFIIPLFIPHAGCLHQCTFCNQHTITGTAVKFSIDPLVKTVEKFLSYKKNRLGPTQIAFYGGTFLGLSKKRIHLMLEMADTFFKKGVVDSIRFSTRPDTITRDMLDFIKDYPISTVEIGAQSMDDAILSLTARGHTASDTVDAVFQLKQMGYQTGLQMMVGLPGDDGVSSFKTAQKIVALKPDFVRIYPTLVIKGSPLAVSYEKGDFNPLSLEKSVQLCKQIYSLFEANNIKVIRLGLQASSDLDDQSVVLAGPYHPSFGHLVFSEILYQKAIAHLDKLENISDKVVLYVHPKQISEMRGIRNSNVEKITNRFKLKKLQILSDIRLERNEVRT